MDLSDLPKIQGSVDERWPHPTNILTETVTEGLKYLTVVHLARMSGVLSFMGATKTTDTLLIRVLLCFFLGVAFVGGRYFYRYFHLGQLVRGWIADPRKMYADDSIDWRSFLSRDKARTNVRHDFGRYAEFVSYGCFFWGGVSGFSGVVLFVAKAQTAW
ncbi:hypothetical protein WI25_36425 [Burkholderia cepacia]|uniref:hypothetical protein n=1 Tax=Burkholderia cepacia TaxID=292 RepID=UPI0007584994|nr:hypothetical protein [Burkholderia cepacia]KUY83605.1 hypothetical protein WI25_36425 [Burkholderia cepacia]